VSYNRTESKITYEEYDIWWNEHNREKLLITKMPLWGEKIIAVRILKLKKT